MPATTPSFADEIVSAFRGSWALLIGNRRAPDYFDFSTRGMVGSFIAMLAVVGVEALLPLLLGAADRPGTVTRAFVSNVVLYVAQMGCSALVLRQLGRLDGLWPFIVSVNWVTSLLTVVAMVLVVTRLDPMILLLLVGVTVFVIQINIARLIVTLSAVQIVLLLVAQFVGVIFSVLVLAVIFPIDPEDQAALNDGSAVESVVDAR